MKPYCWEKLLVTVVCRELYFRLTLVWSIAFSLINTFSTWKEYNMAGYYFHTAMFYAFPLPRVLTKPALHKRRMSFAKVFFAGLSAGAIDLHIDKESFCFRIAVWLFKFGVSSQRKLSHI